MATEKEYVATVHSSNQIKVHPFPDPLRGKLYLWSHPRRGDVVQFDIGEGVLMRCVGGCMILVRFDDDAAIEVGATGVRDNFGTIQFNDYDGFTQRMFRAKRVNIEVEIGYEGSFVFSFNVSGFDANRYKPARGKNSTQFSLPDFDWEKKHPLAVSSGLSSGASIICA